MNITVFEDDLPDNFEFNGDIAIDTETMGLNLHRDRLCLLQFSDANENAYIVHFLSQNYSSPNLKKLLLNKEKSKLFHFARFDLASIKKYLEIDLENIFCTKVASKLSRTYTDTHGLKSLCRELLGVQLSKEQQSSYWGSQTLSKEQLEYAAKDVIYLHRLREVLQRMLARENKLEVANKLFEFLPTRANLDLEGWNDIDILAY